MTSFHPAGLVSFCFLTTAIIMGCGSSSETKPSDAQTAKSTAAEAPIPPVSNPKDAEVEANEVGTLTVYSTPPGCLVFVDKVAVRADGDRMALTPCELTVPRGKHEISVEKPGGRRKSEQIDLAARRELEFDVSSSRTDFDDPSLLNAALFEAAVGRSIALESLNSPDQELDPYLTEDGLTIYFASDRSGVRGIYSATRPSPYHQFNEPALVPQSSGSDMPVSPSISGDGLILVFSVPEKARLWQVTRSDASAPFAAREIMRSDENAERAWRSVQLSSDGLRLYWTEEGADSLKTRAAVRASTNKLFGKTLAFELAGHHPHISADGLRQFSFDGEKLKRSRRGSARQPFGEPELIAELQLDNYKSDPAYRQFWVSDDEQWLFYCNQPNAKSDLFVVRLSDGPAWGRQYVAKSVADKMNVATTEPETKPVPEKPKEPVDPKASMTYAQHWAELTTLLTELKANEAVALVRESQQTKSLKGDRQLLEWDLELAQSQVEFVSDIQKAIAGLKPGASVRVGGTKFDFDRVEDDVLHLKLKDKEVTRRFKDLTPAERIALADSGPDKADAVKALRFAIYLYFQGPSQQSIADSWFKRAGAGGTEFFERLARRALQQAQTEFAHENISAGMKLLDLAGTVGGPNTEAAKQAARERNSLYEKLVWQTVGPRKWEKGEQGEFGANLNRTDGSFLKSDRKYGDFELNCEWRITGPTGGTAMGGVYVRYSGQGKPLENGAKIHLASDSDLKRMDRFATGALFAQKAPDSIASLAEGKWNTLRIQVRGRDIQVWINDKQVLQSTFDKDVPNNGYVMLDGVAGGISYRKVLVFELQNSP